jgi:uncharacterized protein YbjT (DUF2867 family)
MILVCGATGLLGSVVCQQLRGQGQAVRALVRPGADAGKVAPLRQAGIEIVEGDLKNSASLREAVQGADSVVSTASAMVSQRPDDSIGNVDLEGNLALVDAAVGAGLRHFTFVSFPFQPHDYPLQHAKQQIEARLADSGMAHTIVRSTFFTEVWLGPALWPHFGFNPQERRARIAGDGQTRLRWVSFLDVAEVVSAAAAQPGSGSGVLEVAGPEQLSLREVAALFEARIGTALAIDSIPEQALAGGISASEDSRQKSFAALMLACAKGDPAGFTSNQLTRRIGKRRVVDFINSLRI